MTMRGGEVEGLLVPLLVLAEEEEEEEEDLSVLHWPLRLRFPPLQPPSPEGPKKDSFGCVPTIPLLSSEGSLLGRGRAISTLGNSTTIETAMSRGVPMGAKAANCLNSRRRSEEEGVMPTALLPLTTTTAARRHHIITVEIHRRPLPHQHQHQQLVV